MRTSTKIYAWGITMVVLGGASLADHITDGVGSFPISAVVFGLGFVLVCMSYGYGKKD
ncbi:MAG: hypothetical protein IIY21_25550 [Clostridiales bacterium]|jgi:hypothetical protein|nr:hypothetical protein [Clostridiales bacterium]